MYQVYTSNAQLAEAFPGAQFPRIGAQINVVGKVIATDTPEEYYYVVCSELIALEVDPDANWHSAQVFWWVDNKEGNPVETRFFSHNDVFEDQGAAFSAKDQKYDDMKNATGNALTVPVDVIQ